MAEEILGLLKKDYVYLRLEKKDTTALQNSVASYIKVIHYCCFALSTHTILIVN